MPVGYGARCRVCNSPLRSEADRHKIEDGWNDQRVADWLVEHGLVVSRVAVRSHFVNHLDVKADARREYQRAQTVHEAAVEKRVSDIERLDRSVELNARISEEYAKATLVALKSDRKLSMVQVTAGTAAFSELRQAITAKAKLLGDTPQDDLAELLISALAGDGPDAMMADAGD